MIELGRPHVWPTVAGVGLALLFMPVLQELGGELRDIVDDWYPPAVVEVERLPVAEPNTAFIRMTTTKQRECDLLRTMAYTQQPDGTMSRVTMERVDHREADTLPAGTIARSKPWRIYPVAPGDGVVIFAEHGCGSRTVRTRIVDLGPTNG